MFNKRQLTIQVEAEREIRQSREECKHVFGPSLLAIDADQDETMYFAICKKCGYRAD